MGNCVCLEINSWRFEPQSRAHYQEKVSWVKTGKGFWLLINVKFSIIVNFFSRQYPFTNFQFTNFNLPISKFCLKLFISVKLKGLLSFYKFYFKFFIFFYKV